MKITDDNFIQMKKNNVTIKKNGYIMPEFFRNRTVPKKYKHKHELYQIFTIWFSTKSQHEEPNLKWTDEISNDSYGVRKTPKSLKKKKLRDNGFSIGYCRKIHRLRHSNNNRWNL